MSSGPYCRTKYDYRHLRWPRVSVAPYVASVAEPPYSHAMRRCPMPVPVA